MKNGTSSKTKVRPDFPSPKFVVCIPHDCSFSFSYLIISKAKCENTCSFILIGVPITFQDLAMISKLIPQQNLTLDLSREKRLPQIVVQLLIHHWLLMESLEFLPAMVIMHMKVNLFSPTVKMNM